MSNKTNETIADILAWLRRPREGENAYLTLWRDEIADRIDAAYKRECEQLNAEIEAMSKFNDAHNEQMKECASECEKLKNDNARLRVINY